MRELRFGMRCTYKGKRAVVIGECGDLPCMQPLRRIAIEGEDKIIWVFPEALTPLESKPVIVRVGSGEQWTAYPEFRWV